MIISGARYPVRGGSRLTTDVLARHTVQTAGEIAFLNLGPGAQRWLIEAGAVGAQRIRSKMAHAVELAAVVGTAQTRSDLIVIDDIGALPAGQDAAEAFYRVIDAAYERRSVAVTSNIKPSGFDTIMPKTQIKRVGVSRPFERQRNPRSAGILVRAALC